MDKGTWQKLIKTVSYARSNSPFYRDALQHLPENENEWEPALFTQIRTTTKTNLAENNNAFLAVHNSEIFDVSTTSGTTGKPIYFYLSYSDLDRLAVNEAQSIRIAGGSSSDVFQLMTTINKQFMAGMAYYEGIKKLGARILRVGPGALTSQLDNILTHHPTYLIAIPSFIPALIAAAQKRNIDLNSTSVKGIICIGEPIRNNNLTPNHIATSITDSWHVQLYSTYASTEMSTAYTECSEGKGCHEQSDLIYTEVLDENDQEVRDGETGEVVVTTLGVKAMPLIRYRTGDICTVYRNPCKCGNTSLRLGPVLGRKDLRMKIKGTTIYPRSIQLEMARIGISSYTIVLDKNEQGLDEITLVFPKTIDQSVLEAHLRENLPVIPRFTQLPTESIHALMSWKSSRKPRFVFDIRTDQEAREFLKQV